MNQDELRNVTLAYCTFVGAFALVIVVQLVRLWRRIKAVSARTSDHMSGDHFIVNR